MGIYREVKSVGKIKFLNWVLTLDEKLGFTVLLLTRASYR